MTHRRTTAMSRRQMLARSAVVGGALWVAPTVTAVSLTPAHAATPSGTPPTKPPPETPHEPPGTPETSETPETQEPGTPTEKPSPSDAPTATTPERTAPSRAPSEPDNSGTPGRPGDAGGSVGPHPTAGKPLADTGANDVAMLAALGGAALVGGAAAVARSKATTPSASEASQDH